MHSVALAAASCITQHDDIGIHMRASLFQILQQSRGICPGDQNDARRPSLSTLLLTEQSNAVVCGFVRLDSCS